jgi:cytochrome b pre-mRNA-processing protein 3
MLQTISRFFRPSMQRRQAYALYARLTEEARQPFFYEQGQVPDTLDGRFEMILLHLFLYLQRLKQEGDHTDDLQRELIEAFFEDMDRSVRELGVGDTGVGRRVKAMANACYGRLHAYTQAVEDEDALADALKTNLYGTLETPPDEVSLLTDYMQRRRQELERQPLDTLVVAA